MAYDVRHGLQAVREMQGRIRGIYGPLIDLVRPVGDRYCIAADEAAGSALFHVVVDTDDTAARIIRQQCGAPSSMSVGRVDTFVLRST
ncbi:hypothetical protein DVH05_015689 [Phytophthora capsici]|nr:hypothetical protein DVH05_015689 [Phytophthora capsici]